MRALRVLVSVLCVVMVFVAAWSQSALQVFVNDQPFPGVTSGDAEHVQIDAEALSTAVSIGLHVDGAQVRLGQEPVPATVLEGKTMIDAKALVRRLGGRYVVDEANNRVNLYLSKPVAAVPAPATVVAHPSRYSIRALKVPDGTLRGQMFIARPLPAGVIPDDVQAQAETTATTLIDGMVTRQEKLLVSASTPDAAFPDIHKYAQQVIDEWTHDRSYKSADLIWWDKTECELSVVFQINGQSRGDFARFPLKAGPDHIFRCVRLPDGPL